MSRKRRKQPASATKQSQDKAPSLLDGADGYGDLKSRINAVSERAQSVFSGIQAGITYGYELTGTYHESSRKRNLYDQAGYPDIVVPDMLFNMYRRFGLAKAVVDLKPNKTWQKPPVVYEGEADKDRRAEKPTEFEKVFDKYAKKWKLWDRLLGVDKRQRVMRYAGLLIICREPTARKPHEPLERVIGPEAIVKFKPVYETEIIINEAHQDITQPEYGLPKMFQFRARTPGSRNPWENEQYELHPSRVITFAEGADDDSPYGVSSLEPVYNALMDAEKTRMAGAEGQFKKAKQRTVINLDEEIGSPPDADEDDPELAAMHEAIDKFERDMNNMLIMQGASAQTLDTTLADPNSAWMLAVNEIAAAEETPATIFIGQQTGRLASDEDNTYFASTVTSRRKSFGSDMVLTFIERLTDIGALPRHGELTIEWDNISDPTQSEKLDSASKMAAVNKTDFDAGGSGAIFSENEMRETAGFEPLEEDELEREREVEEEPEDIGE